MADIMGHIGNTDHNVDHTTIGIPVQEKMLVGSAELDIYGELGMLMNRVVKLEREMADIQSKVAEICVYESNHEILHRVNKVMDKVITP